MAKRRPIHPKGLLGRFVRDQRGVSAIIFAIALPVLIGFVGIGVEVGLWFARKRNLQAAADAGAMAGALVLYQGGTWDPDAKNAASDFAVLNGAIAANVTSNNPPNNAPNSPTTDYTADTAAVEVLLTESQTLMFSAIFLSTNVTVGARAVATAGTRALGCVVALDSSASEAVRLDSNAEMNLNGCGLTVNSSSSNALQMMKLKERVLYLVFVSDTIAKIFQHLILTIQYSNLSHLPCLQVEKK